MHSDTAGQTDADSRSYCVRVRSPTTYQAYYFCCYLMVNKDEYKTVHIHCKQVNQLLYFQLLCRKKTKADNTSSNYGINRPITRCVKTVDVRYWVVLVWLWCCRRRRCRKTIRCGGGTGCGRCALSLISGWHRRWLNQCMRLLNCLTCDLLRSGGDIPCLTLSASIVDGWW